MQLWIEIFIIVAAVAIVIQTLILAALFFQVRRTMQRVEFLIKDLQSRFTPILTRMQMLLDETQPKIAEMVRDAAHVVYLARAQAQKVDRIFTDAADRIHGQLLHVDRILTGVMESVEDAGVKFRRGFWTPVQKASAVIQGIKVGLDFLRSHRRRSSPYEGSEQEEELFI